MNILFLLKSFDVGGVEVVTSVLANRFASEGHHVVLWAFYRHEPTLERRLSDSVHIVYGNSFSASRENVESLVRTIDENMVDIVINQWALPPQSTSLLKKVIRKHPARIISVYHSDPMTNGRLMGIDTSLRNTVNPLNRWLLKCKRYAYKTITSYSMSRCYKMSDMFVVLADSYKQHLADFIGVKNPDHLVAIGNPVTIDRIEPLYDKRPKEKRILYVGRLESKNKKPERVLNVWSNICREYEDWHLDIVGDGPEKEKLEQMVSWYGLQRIHFYGFQQPERFYQSASLLLLTSDFEGFPLVIVEAMSYGVIPIVYGSFSAVYDIIDDEKNGVIVSKTEKDFNAKMMADKCKTLILDDKKRSNMVTAAIAKSKNYSIDKIYEQWMKVFNELYDRK